jgi:hypothetical protein
MIDPVMDGTYEGIPVLNENGEWEGLAIPSVSTDTFFRRLAEIKGSPLTAEETERGQKLSRKGWLLRNIADKLFGVEHTNKALAPK